MVRVLKPKAFVPKPPARVTSQGVSPDTIWLLWQTSAGALFYTVYRSTSASGPFNRIAGVPPGFVQGYSDAGLAPNTTYYYVVTASNADGESGQSGPPAAATTLLLPPSGVQAHGGSATSIDVSWQSAGSSIVSYTISRSSSAAGIFNTVGTVYTAQNTFPGYSDTGLTPGARYYYQVALATSSNHSLPSTPPVSAATLADPVTGEDAQATSATSILVTWNPSRGATGYGVMTASSAAGPFSFLGNTNTPSFMHTGLAPQSTHCYHVLAWTNDGAGQDTFEAPVCATTPAVSSPVMVAAQAVGAHRIRVSWSAAPGATSYTVYRSTNPAAGQWVTASPAGGAMPPFDDTGNLPAGTNGLASNTTYYYEIKSSDGAGHVSPASATASATTWLNQPVLVEAHSTNATTIQITWSPVAGATSYTVSRSLSMSGPFAPIAGQPVNGPPVNDSPGVPGTTFFYEVSAANTSGNTSPTSDPASATLAPPPPTDLQISVTGSGSGLMATIYWMPSAGATSYSVFSSPNSNLPLGAWTLLHTQPSSSTTFPASGSITVGLWYTVTATNAGGSSAMASPKIWTVSAGPGPGP